MQYNSTMPKAQAAAPPTDLLRGASLFLDFDGTLVELADRPDAVSVSDRLKRVLAALDKTLDGRLAIISGRGAGDIHAMIGGQAYTVVGSHGMEFHFAGGRTIVAPRPIALDAVQHEAERLALQWPGVIVEHKPLGIALHYRLSPVAERACKQLAAELAAEHGLHLQTGKMMVELRAAGGDKGSAIRSLLEQEPTMRGTRPVFIGDDDTDEPGFVTVEEMGGAGILVGTRQGSAARYRLSGVAEVVDWLEAACRT